VIRNRFNPRSNVHGNVMKLLGDQGYLFEEGA